MIHVRVSVAARIQVRRVRNKQPKNAPTLRHQLQFPHLQLVQRRPMSSNHDRTPSPPPPPPIPLTPGPRATKFSALFSSALTKTLSTVSLSKFSACFPTPARHCPHILASVHSQIIQGVEERARREFDEILKERDVVAGLNELERLVAEAKGRRQRGVKEGLGVVEA